MPPWPARCRSGRSAGPRTDAGRSVGQNVQHRSVFRRNSVMASISVRSPEVDGSERGRCDHGSGRVLPLPWRVRRQEAVSQCQAGAPASIMPITSTQFVNAADFGEVAPMGLVTRLLVSLVLAVAFLATAVYQPATALTAEVAAAQMPCCDDDCPQDPACASACVAMMRCAAVSSSFVPPSPSVGLSLAVSGVLHNGSPLWQVDERLPDGLKRPPRI